eukprot:570066-Pelagomonas_calceolata.AAC.1
MMHRGLAAIVWTASCMAATQKAAQHQRSKASIRSLYDRVGNRAAVARAGLGHSLDNIHPIGPASLCPYACMHMLWIRRKQSLTRGGQGRLRAQTRRRKESSDDGAFMVRLIHLPASSFQTIL